MHRPLPAGRFRPAHERVISGPRSSLKKCKKFLLNDVDFMNEFKHY